MIETDPTLAGLLRAVLESPDDDVPRLVLADWLDENGGAGECPRCNGRRFELVDTGDPFGTHLRIDCLCGSGRVSDGRWERAEFIRVQCELAQLDAGPRCSVCDWPYRSDGGCEPGNCSFRPDQQSADYAGWKQRQTAYHTLRRRERELLESHSPRWTEELRDTLPDMGQYTPIIDAIFDDEANRPVIGIGWYRGFVEAITCDLATLFGSECHRCGDGGNVRADCGGCDVNARTPGIAAALFGSQPVRGVTLTDAVIHPSGGNMTYYVGGMGQFPRKYWRSLDNLPSRKAALSALSAACVARGRELAGLPALEVMT